MFLYLSSGGLLGWAAVGAAWAVWRDARRAGPVLLAMLSATALLAQDEPLAEEKPPGEPLSSDELDSLFDL